MGLEKMCLEWLVIGYNFTCNSKCCIVLRRFINILYFFIRILSNYAIFSIFWFFLKCFLFRKGVGNYFCPLHALAIILSPARVGNLGGWEKWKKSNIFPLVLSGRPHPEKQLSPDFFTKYFHMRSPKLSALWRKILVYSWTCGLFISHNTFPPKLH